MSVHTLWEEKNGTVTIGANITKGEALKAGPQILKFCYEVNGLAPPFIVDAEVERDGGCYHDHGITIAPSPAGHPSNQPGVMVRAHGDVRISVREARHLAWHLMLHAQQAEDDPDPAEVKTLAEFFDASMNTSPEELARTFLRNFQMPEERTS